MTARSESIVRCRRGCPAATPDLRSRWRQSESPRHGSGTLRMLDRTRTWSLLRQNLVSLPFASRRKVFSGRLLHRCGETIDDSPAAYSRVGKPKLPDLHTSVATN